MEIKFDTSSATPEELNALMALVASLGGRLPHLGPVMPEVAEAAPASIVAPSPRDEAEALMAAESARVASTAPPPPAEGTPVLDTDGIPWDERIHASTKSQNKDGTWKKLRGVDEVTYGRIHAELQEQHAGNRGTGTTTDGPESQPSATVAAPPAPTPESSSPAAPPPPAPDAGNAPPPPPPATANAPTAAAPPAPEPAASAPAAGKFAGFPEFVQAVNGIRKPTIPYLELNGFAADLGVPGGFKDMKDHPELWETFYGIAGGQ